MPINRTARRQYNNRVRGAKAVRGTGAFRKLLRRLPDQMRAELVVELAVTGRQIKQAMQARAPKRSGDLQAGIGDRVLPRSLRLQIGLIGTPRGRSKLFYGRIQDLGRAAQIVSVTRRIKGFRGSSTLANGKPRMRRSRSKANPGQLRQVGSAYNMKVAASAAKRFVTGRYPDLRRELNTNLKGIFARSLGKLAGGGDE